MYLNGYRCVACNSNQEAVFEGFLCPECGGNLDVSYDYRAASAEFVEALASGTRDMFRYQALLPVRIPEPPFPLKVGGTPLYAAARLGRRSGLTRLYLKDEGRNPSASLKDRATAIALRRAMDTGAEVICAASTGNAGSSLACLAAAHGMQSVIFVPQSAPPAKLSQSLCHSARVFAVHGSYDDAYDLCLAAAGEFGWFNRSTGHNPFTREGKKTCAFEIWEDLGRQVPDRVVVSSGDGNILSGIWKGFRDLEALGLIDRLPKIDCAQSKQSAAIRNAVHKLRADATPVSDWSQVEVTPVRASTLADSISVNLPRDGLAAVRAVLESGGEAVTVTDGEILDAMKEMASFSGVYPEPAAAAPWAAVKYMSASGVLQADERVVCVVSGSGLKDTVSASRAAGSPEVIDPDVETLRRIL